MNYGSNDPLVLFQSIFEQASDAIYIIDPKTSNIVGVNQAGCDDVGMKRDEVLNHSVLSLQDDVVDLKHWQQILPAIKEAGTYVFSGRHLRKDGSSFPVEVHSNFFSHSGEELLVSIARDISKRVALEQQLQKREPQLNYVLEIASDGLWDWNVQTDEVFFSPQLKRMLGYGPHEMKPHLDQWVNNVHPDDLVNVQTCLANHISGEARRYEAKYRLRKRNGDYLWVHDHGAICKRDEKGKPLRAVGMVHDITKEQELKQRLEWLAAYDDLTGLLNRRAGYEQFQKHIDYAKREQHSLSVVIFDVDNFKEVNDRCGHLIGDGILKEIAQRLLAGLRSFDVLLRWGGEEFLLLMPKTTKEEAFIICERLREMIAQWDNRCTTCCTNITISCGLSSYAENGDTIELLVQAADEAMLSAKGQGRNRTLIAS